MEILKKLYNKCVKNKESKSELCLDNAPKELKDAEKRCPNVKFVKSCREHYEKFHYLSVGQRNALRYAGTPFRKERYHNGYEPILIDIDEDNPFDPDRD